jgi:hypothetical protein
VSSAVHPEFHDHAGKVEDHPVQRILRKQIGERLPTQVQA